MQKLKIIGPQNPVHTAIHISGSKSISNRALIIRALCKESFSINNLSDSDDTRLLEEALNQVNTEVCDVHHAGTSFRFLSAYLAIKKGSTILTGSDRMKQRPIRELVDALRLLGADIDYLEKEGYPPLRVNNFEGQKNESLRIKADVSSQFISALCMIAPILEKGLKIKLEGKLVSQPYLKMTLDIMSCFGVPSRVENDEISIEPGQYTSRDFIVESDWSSASYHFGICSLLPGSKIGLSHFFENSMQGDSAISKIAESFGVKTKYTNDGIFIISNDRKLSHYEYDFIDQPDLFQTVAVMAAGKGIKLKAKGLKTLAIKETDRTKALSLELSKAGITLKQAQDPEWEYELYGDICLLKQAFASYNDHRMAMSMAMLACVCPVTIEDPMVVSKSYPRFWKDLKQMGFHIKDL